MNTQFLFIFRSKRQKFPSRKQLELPFLDNESEPSSTLTSPTYITTPTSEQNVLLMDVNKMIDNDLYSPSVKPYYTHFLPTAYEVWNKHRKTTCIIILYIGAHKVNDRLVQYSAWL